MSDTVVSKKKWSKKKKILVIVLSIVGFLLAATLCTGIGVLNWYCKTVDYNIVSAHKIMTEDVHLIAHRGFRAKAPENTAPAFEFAGQAGYWGAECDTYRTKDGVWVVQHDSNTYRMMDSARFVEKTTFDKLLKDNTDNGNNIENYKELKICTLDKYLEICEQYNMTAVIELKGKNNTEHYDEIVALTDKHDCKVVYISFHKEALEAMRKLSADQMFYLVNEITVDDIIFAKDLGSCGIEFNAAEEKNFEDDAAIIKKCRESKLELGAWTIDDPDVMKKCIDLGVTYITTNCITK